MREAAEEEKQPQDRGRLLVLDDFNKIKTIAESYYNIAKHKIDRPVISPQEESKIITSQIASMIVDVQDSVKNIVGSDDAFDRIISQVRNNGIQDQRGPGDNPINQLRPTQRPPQEPPIAPAVIPEN